jgi:type IV pilus assembly protein PilA
MKLKNKYGFTLIELLAVIVVLAIIALIATPIVMNTIKRSKKGAAERSADNYIKQVETAVAEERLNKNEVLEGEYQITSDGNLCRDKSASCSDNNKIKIEMSGTKPTSGKIKITNGSVDKSSSTMTIGDYDVTYNSTKKTYETTEKGTSTKTYANGEVVYFNVTTGEKCSNYTETQSNIGTKSGCMKFYAFNDNGGSNVNLLLDHNTTAEVFWNLKVSTASGPKEVLNQLKKDTALWQGTITPENYSIDQSEQCSGVKYAVDYSDYKARLITAQEVAQITGNTTFDEKTSSSIFYFDTNTTTESKTCKYGNTSGCNYGWLYDRTDTDCTNYGCLNNSDLSTYGYWTISPNASTSGYAWSVYYNGGTLTNGYVGGAHRHGVRPVITVAKSNLS